MNYSDLPMVTCPHCDQEFQLDDYYDITGGDSFECDNCEKEIYVLSTETVTRARLGKAWEV